MTEAVTFNLSRSRRRRTGAGVAAAVALVVFAAVSAPSGSGALSVVRRDGSDGASIEWMQRHGDEEEGEEVHHEMMGEDEDAHPGGISTIAPSQAQSSHHTHQQSSPGDASNGSDGAHDEDHIQSSMSHIHHHTHLPSAIDMVPSAEMAGSTLIEIPERPHITGHAHAHGHGGPTQLSLNETTLFRSHGPDPLSYMEWDFSWGLGRTSELARFTNEGMRGHNVSSEAHLMGVSEGRWRTLVDADNLVERRAIEQDIRNRLGQAAQEPSRHKTLLLLHVATSILACIFLLPTLLVLRAASSRLASLFAVLYMGTLSGSMFLSFLYKAMTPNLYPSNAHGRLGWAIFWISCIVFAGDLCRAFRSTLLAFGGASGSALQRISVTCRAMVGGKLAQQESYRALDEQELLGRCSGEEAPRASLRTEYEHHVRFADLHEDMGRGCRMNSGSSHGSGSGNGTASPTSTLCDTPRKMSFSEGGHNRANSIGAALPFLSWKLRGEDSKEPVQSLATSTGAADTTRSPTSLWRSILKYTHVTVARSLTLISFAAVYTGIAVYTGSCRGDYKNTCLAHGIKGGIFFAYGLLTFGRYLGAYSELGWAWNRRPSARNSRDSSAPPWQRNAVSAEWVESFVCFFYGSTNMWMERFGAEAGDPYTIKQIQHIGIAVMFCFCGLVGVILETRWIRDLLARSAAQAHPSARRVRGPQDGCEQFTADGEDRIVAAQSQPPSYSGFFNPFPALVIGVTGLAMAAHAQNIEYERVIHVLWGNLLAGFSVMRCLTYFFLWLRPPVSVLPSRPPTEALGSFSLACGGLVFMLSSEQVSQWALRAGYADAMAVANVSIALIALLFAWTAVLLLIKAAAMRREARTTAKGASLRLSECVSRRAPSWTASDAASEPVFVLGDEDDYQKDMETGRDLSNTESLSRDLTRSPEQMGARDLA
ncbi:hypothetical protein CBOM_04672 [Ceraceosorus bombacis]|uniref:Integral membrane protein n=1 Tax=Ceraceosorus bombacis TaxID=401625 RepID=A0A0P1BPN2_9BASI|nr:hypothetical protein CBOM_04672 [Ceraceosorus bombacis]